MLRSGWAAVEFRWEQSTVVAADPQPGWSVLVEGPLVLLSESCGERHIGRKELHCFYCLVPAGNFGRRKVP